MVLDPILQSLPVHFFGSRPQPPTSRRRTRLPIQSRDVVSICLGTCMCDMTILHVHDREMLFLFVWGHIRVTWLIRVCPMIRMWHIPTSVRANYVTHMYESCHTYESVMSNIFSSHATRMRCLCVAWLIRTCQMTRISQKVSFHLQ